jgi:hypothetical protein
MANNQRERSRRLVQHFEEPKRQVFVSLTPIAIAGLDALGQRYGVQGRSAFFEQLRRGMLHISQPTAKTKLNGLYLRRRTEEVS